MVPLSFLQTGYIAIRDRDSIDWGLLLKRVLPLMLLGMGFAFFLLTKVGGPWLGLAFGIMVLLLSARDLYQLRFATAGLEKPISRPASAAAMFGAGVVHGIYASGGPMLVYAIGREGLPKKVFRSTLSMVWILLNVILVTRFMQAHDTSRFIGLNDRGLLEPGRRADINIIDFDNLALLHPTMLKDLPAGGQRLMQYANGYVATLVAGEIIAKDGKLTDARPGRLVRAGRKA